MAHPNLSNSPFFGFPQPILEALDREIQYIDRIVQRELERCEYESPESRLGACDGGFQCSKRATVHDLRTGQEFCLEHFDGIIE
jgi:hypothetical protein